MKPKTHPYTLLKTQLSNLRLQAFHLLDGCWANVSPVLPQVLHLSMRCGLWWDFLLLLLLALTTGVGFTGKSGSRDFANQDVD